MPASRLTVPGAYTRDRARRPGACQAGAAGPEPWSRSPGCRASRHRRRSPPHRSALLLRRRRLFDELHLAIDAQNLRHLLLELRVAAFQVIADLVRLYLPLVE